MPIGTIITSVKDVLAAALGMVESAQKEVVWVIPASINSLSSTLIITGPLRAGQKEKLKRKRRGMKRNRGSYRWI